MLPVPTLTAAYDENVVDITPTWRKKTGTRLAGPSWVSFDPAVGPISGWRLDVLGHPVDPLSAAFNGSRHFHAAHRGVCYGKRSAGAGAEVGQRLAIESLDAPLAAPGDTEHLLNFDNRQPELENGFHFNLHNNSAWEKHIFRLRLNPPHSGCWGAGAPTAN
jgi:hypothetical protein